MLKKFVNKKLILLILSAGTMLNFISPVGENYSEVQAVKFSTEAHPNHYGRSAVRAFLNAGLGDFHDFTKRNFEVNSVEDSSEMSEYARRHFTRAQVDSIETVNVVTRDNFSCDLYATRDKFFLPSGSQSKRSISWNSSADLQITQEMPEYLIPSSYLAWNKTNSGGSCFTRSAAKSAFQMLKYTRGFSTFPYYTDYTSFSPAAALKINLTSQSNNIIFAAAASLFYRENSEGYLEKSDEPVVGTKVFNFHPGNAGRDTEKEHTIRGGMFLKTEDIENRNFEITEYKIEDNNLKISYKNAPIGQNKYITICGYYAFGTDAFITYCPVDESGIVNVDISGLTHFLDSEKVKFDIWMETPADELHAFDMATKPLSLRVIRKDINDNYKLTTNLRGLENSRIFALKDDMNCSWGNFCKKIGTLGNIYNDNYSINRTQPAPLLRGADATNQIIYFGTYKCKPDGFVDENPENNTITRPLRFWIAGREDLDEFPVPVPLGDLMTLYQIEAVDIQPFNDFWKSNYAENLQEQPVTSLERLFCDLF